MDHQFQPNTNHFLNKVNKIGKLKEGTIRTDIFHFYLNIPHREGLAFLYKFLETMGNKQISNDTLAEVAEIVLKIIYLNLMKKVFKQKCGPTIGTKFVSPYAIFYMLILKKTCWKFLKKKKKQDFLEVYRWHIFHLGKWWRITKSSYISS